MPARAPCHSRAPLLLALVFCSLAPWPRVGVTATRPAPATRAGVAAALPADAASGAGVATPSSAVTTPAAIVPPAVTGRGARWRWISASGAELMREVWEAGGLRGNPQVRAVVERMQLEESLEGPETPKLPQPAVQPAAGLRTMVQELGTDAIANDRSLSTCTCGGRPISEAEPSVAAWGPYVLASWNDRRNNCGQPPGSPSQSHAYSRDYGMTFREGALLRGPGSIDVFHGDPTVAVNKKTGDFYISGILRQGSTFVGVVALRGHFGPDTFVIDTRREIALAQGDDFLDKPWMAVDSLSGNVYITWTNFPADFSSRIELQRLDPDLNPLGPIQVVRNEPYGLYGVQGSDPVVGPDGVLYVGYSVLFADTLSTLWSTPGSIEVRRSDDFGLSFGPAHTVSDAQYHPLAVPPGNQRGFWAQLVAMDADRTAGPYRGRLYAVWAENRPLGGAVYGSDAVVEVENNGFFANATPFTIGATLRGFSNGVDNDLFKFTGQRGQVFWCNGDSVPGSLRVRLICPADTSALSKYHLLHTRSPISGGSDAFACVLPYDGTYYLQIESPFTNFLPYRFSTALVPAVPGHRVRGIRDEFVAYSDDGATWSAPRRLNDNDPWFDGSEPQVAVDGRGRVYAFWLDWRDDPQCGTSSSDYTVASGDGGVTWGPNRRLSDASSFWGALASCSDNNQGDFMQMAADGDHVYAAFPDSRLGDPDIFVDASRYASSSQCPPRQVVPPGADAFLAFTLANDGNFATPLAWRLDDTRGWLTGASPSLSGQTLLAGAGGSQLVAATVHAPTGCDGESTVVHFTISDPAIPGHEDVCSAAVRCDGTVATLLALVERSVVEGRVALTWFAADAAGEQGVVYRMDIGGTWTERAVVHADGRGNVAFVDTDVSPGLHGYRLVMSGPGGSALENTVWVEVPALALALRAGSPNPTFGGPLTISFALPSAAPATLDVLDPAGRRRASRAVGGMGAGRHELRLAELGDLPSGVYLVRLTQSGRNVSAKAVVVR